MKIFKSISLILGLTFGLATAVWLTLSAAPATAATQTIPFPDQRDAATAAVQWLITNHQNDDGGYASFSSGANMAPSTIEGTIDAVIAIASTGYNPAHKIVMGQSQTPLDYLQTHTAEMEAFAMADGGSAGKLVLALTSMGQNPRSFLGRDFVAVLNSHNSGGQFANPAFRQALAILGLAAAGEVIPTSATQALIDGQEPGGSWDDGFGTADNVDATAMAVMALVAAETPLTSTALVSASTFLSTSHVAQGWAYSPSFGDPNPNSTALAVQALSALGEDFHSAASPWVISSTTPLSALLDFQNATGAFQADFGSGPFDDFFATVQGVVGATGRPYPLPARYEAAKQAVSCLDNIQDPATAGWAQFGTGPANAGGTARAMEAIAQFGDYPNGPRWAISGTTPISALASLTPSYVSDGGRVGVVMQGVVAGRGDVANFAGFNLPVSMTQFLSPTGEYAPINFGILAHAEGMLGLEVANQPVDPSAVALLNSQVMTDDLWSSFDDTGIAINVLSRLSETLPSNTFSSVMQAQLPTGGWEAFGSLSVNSTSEIVQGLYAADEYPFSPKWSQVVSGVLTNSADAVMALQTANGCWQPFGGDDAFSTTDGIILLMVDFVAPQRIAYLPFVSK